MFNWQIVLMCLMENTYTCNQNYTLIYHHIYQNFIIFLFSALKFQMASLTHKESVTAVAKANDNFTSKLYGHLVSTAGKDSNMVVSPFSISAVMAMAYAGARENTAMQMQSVLSFPEKDLTLQEGYEEMFNVLQSNENFTLEAANRLFIHEKYKLLDTYINMVKKHYNALPESVDFGKSEEARSIINTWVENQTKEKIRDLLPSGSIDPLTHVVLVNAVYFKGDWKIKFEEADTCKKKFRTTAGKKVDVDMMHKTAKYKAARIKDLDCTVLEMPYKGDRLNMLLFLSKESKGFDAMEDKFASLDIVNLEMHGECEFHVSLPRFKLETSHDLVDNLKAIGLKDMFGSNADFSGIDGSKNLYVKCVMQKAFIEVNEEGSEAAAATAMVINYKSSRVTHPQTFICNRPFLFAIKDQLTGMVLFTGRVANPNKDYKPNCATMYVNCVDK
jgi:serpin B